MAVREADNRVEPPRRRSFTIGMEVQHITDSFPISADQRSVPPLNVTNLSMASPLSASFLLSNAVMKGIYSIRDNSPWILMHYLARQALLVSACGGTFVLFLDTDPAPRAPGSSAAECSQLLNVRLNDAQNTEAYETFRKLQDRREYASISQMASANATAGN